MLLYTKPGAYVSLCERIPYWQTLLTSEGREGRAQPKLCPPERGGKEEDVRAAFLGQDLRGKEDTHPNQLQIHILCELIAEGEIPSYAFSINLCAC